MEQTAVDWLWDELDKAIPYQNIKVSQLFSSLLEQAKQMEIMQHGNTWNAAIQAHEDRGHVIARSFCDFDEYQIK